MPSDTLFRNIFRAWVPHWLSDRTSKGQTVGFRFLWSMIAPLDVAVEHAVQGLQARWPGLGTPTALGKIGADRRIHRGPADTDEMYAIKLQKYLDLWALAGSSEGLARALHDYLPGGPAVRTISRAGDWTHVDTAGNVTHEEHPPSLWNWDSLSHPGRAGNWDDLWIVIYQSHYTKSGPFSAVDGVKWGQEQSFGLDMPQNVALLLRSIMNDWKAAHTQLRGIVITDNPAHFDPSNPGSLMPDGWWGGYARMVSGVWTPARPNYLRYIDPEGSL